VLILVDLGRSASFMGDHLARVMIGVQRMQPLVQVKIYLYNILKTCFHSLK
jgi:hypothetical protein